MSTEVLSVVRLLWDGVGCLCEPPLLIMKVFSRPLFHNVFTRTLKKIDADAGNDCRLQFGLLL